MYDECDVPLLPGSASRNLCEICHEGRPVNAAAMWPQNAAKAKRGAARRMFGRIVHVSCLNTYLVNTEKSGITPGMVRYIQSLPVRKVNNHYTAIGVGMTRGCNEDLRRGAGLAYTELSAEERMEDLFPYDITLEHFLSNKKFGPEIEAARVAARINANDVAHAEKSKKKYAKESASSRTYEVTQDALGLVGKEYALELERADDFAGWITPLITPIDDGWGVFLLNSLCQRHPSQSHVLRSIFRNGKENGALDFDSKLEEISRVGSMRDDAIRFLGARVKMKIRRWELEPVVGMSVEKWLAEKRAPLFFRRSCLSFCSAQDCILALKLIQDNPDLAVPLAKVLTVPLFPDEYTTSLPVFGDELCLNASIRRLALMPDPGSKSLFDDMRAKSFAEDFLGERIRQEVRVSTGTKAGAWDKYTSAFPWLWDRCWAFGSGADFVLAFGKVQRYSPFLGSGALKAVYQVDGKGTIDLNAAHAQLSITIDGRLKMRVGELHALGNGATVNQKLQLEYCLNKRKMLALPRGDAATEAEYGELQCRLGIDRMVRLRVLGDSITKEQKQELEYLKFKVGLVMELSDTCGIKRKR